MVTEDGLDRIRRGRPEDTTGRVRHRPPEAVGGAATGFVLDSRPVLSAPCRSDRQRGIPIGRSTRACAATNSCSSSAPTSRTTRARRSSTGPPAQIVAAGGQIVKVAPWGRRRLAYPIDRHREGSYHIILFEAPPEAIVELEHTLLITEEVLRHLVTRVERPVKVGRGRRLRGSTSSRTATCRPASTRTRTTTTSGEFIDESESEAAPAAID